MIMWSNEARAKVGGSERDDGMGGKANRSRLVGRMVAAVRAGLRLEDVAVDLGISASALWTRAKNPGVTCKPKGFGHGTGCLIRA